MQVTLGDIAAIVATVVFAVLVALLALPLLKLGKVLDELRLAVRGLGEESVPILTELRGTVAATNTEIEKLSFVTEDVAKVSNHASVVSENAAQLATLFRASLGEPLVKIAAFSYGVRRALRTDRSRAGS